MSNKKRFYIAVDLEGVACVVGSGGGLSESANYQFARLQGTREANAAAKALFDCGAEEVIIWDNHGTGVNLDYDLIDERCTILLGNGIRTRFAEIDDTYGGVLFIGYHAYDTIRATLSHTYSSHDFQYQKINGKQVGEFHIDAAFAGRHGVPPIFIASDDVCVAQAKEAFPGIVTVETKKSLAWNGAHSKHPKKVCDEIYEKVKEAHAKASELKPFSFKEPIEYEVRFKHLSTAQNSTLRDINNNLFERIDPFTRRGVLARPEDIFG